MTAPREAMAAALEMALAFTPEPVIIRRGVSAGGEPSWGPPEPGSFTVQQRAETVATAALAALAASGWVLRREGEAERLREALEEVVANSSVFLATGVNTPGQSTLAVYVREDRWAAIAAALAREPRDDPGDPPSPPSEDAAVTIAEALADGAMAALDQIDETRLCPECLMVTIPREREMCHGCRKASPATWRC